MYGTLISSVTVGAGGAASISLSAIPQTFTDLVLVISGRTTFNSSGGYGADVLVNFNSAGTSNYSTIRLAGYGNGVQSVSSATGKIGWITSDELTTNTFGNSVAYIPNYTSANNKAYSVDAVTENNSTTNYMTILAGLWSNTSAITSMVLSPIVGNFMQYSTVYLYGLTKGSGGATVS